jgi:hypothetical protein
MANATADRDAKRQDGELKSCKLSAIKVFKDTLVVHNATGFIAKYTDVANLKFAGVTAEQVDNAAGAAGDKSVRVRKTGEYEFAYAGGDATQALVGQEAYIQDDQTVDEDAALTTNDVKCGVITEVVSTTRVRVRIDGYAR